MENHEKVLCVDLHRHTEHDLRKAFPVPVKSVTD